MYSGRSDERRGRGLLRLRDGDDDRAARGLQVLGGDAAQVFFGHGLGLVKLDVDEVRVAVEGEYLAEVNGAVERAL